LIAVSDNAAVEMTSTRAGSYDFSVTSQERKDYKLSIEKDGFVSQTMDINIAGASEKANSVLRVIEMNKPDDPKAKRTSEPVKESTTAAKTEKSGVKFSVKVVDAATKQALDAKVSLTSVKDKKVVAATGTGTGSYDFSIAAGGSKNYRLSVESDGYIFQNTVISIAGSSTRTIELRKPSVGVTQILHNIYFDFNKATFKQESYDELGKLETMMKQNSAMKVEIAGHTDSFGSDAYNKKLSLARASAVRNFLTLKGIDIKRVSAAGYGDTRPLASNDDEQGGREVNRRVEFKIIGN